MLGDSDAAVTIAVKDVNEAKKFYGETLGLKQEKESPEGVTYRSGNTRILVYPSGYAGTNQATYAGWQVNDIEAVVNDLKSKGVTFEHYPDMMEGMTLEGDVHVMGSMKSAWFKDPSGNILALDNGQM